MSSGEHDNAHLTCTVEKRPIGKASSSREGEEMLDLKEQVNVLAAQVASLVAIKSQEETQGQNWECYSCGKRGHMSRNCPERGNRIHSSYRNGNTVYREQRSNDRENFQRSNQRNINNFSQRGNFRGVNRDNLDSRGNYSQVNRGGVNFQGTSRKGNFTNAYSQRNDSHQNSRAGSYRGRGESFNQNRKRPTHSNNFAFSMFACKDTHLPILSVTINDIPSLFLVDSGASLNIISDEVFKLVEKVECSGERMIIGTATGDNVTLKLSCNLAFKIQDLDFNEKFYMVNGSLSDKFLGILGMPFLRDNGVLISCGDNSIQIKGIENKISCQTSSVGVKKSINGQTIENPDNSEVMETREEEVNMGKTDSVKVGAAEIISQITETTRGNKKNEKVKNMSSERGTQRDFNVVDNEGSAELTGIVNEDINSQDETNNQVVREDRLARVINRSEFKASEVCKQTGDQRKHYVSQSDFSPLRQHPKQQQSGQYRNRRSVSNRKMNCVSREREFSRCQGASRRGNFIR